MVLEGCQVCLSRSPGRRSAWRASDRFCQVWPQAIPEGCEALLTGSGRHPSPLLSARVTQRLDGSGSRRQRPVSFSQLSRVRRRLARKGPGVGGASIADTPGWDVPVTKSSRGRQGRSNQQVRPLRAVALRPAWRGGLGSSACRRRGLVRIDRHGSWVAPVAVCRRQCLV